MASKTAIIAIAVAAVVVVAGVGIAFALNNGSKGPNYANIESKLMIRGNCNGDYAIDNDDMSILKDILNGDKAASEYPLADVNNDGAVNDDDKALLQDILDRKEGINVYVVCLDREGKETTITCKYPLRNGVTYGTNMQMPALFANGGQYVAGYFVSSYDVAEASINENAVDLKGSARTISDKSWGNFTSLDSSLKDKGGVGAILVDYSGIAQITEKRMKDLNDAGIPMICYSSADATDELATVLTLGFLYGGDCEKLGRDYAKIGWDVVALIKEKITEDVKKKSYICGTMFIYVCGASSSFNTSATTAGGVAYASLNAEFNKKYTKNSTTMEGNTEALSNYTDADIFINNRSMDWGLKTSDEKKDLIIDTWDHDNKGVSSQVYFSKFLNKLVYVNNLLPGGAKLAYMAHAMYGDIFSLEWADGILKDYIDIGTEPLKDQTMDSVLAYITYDDYKAVTA